MFKLLELELSVHHPNADIYLSRYQFDYKHCYPSDLPLNQLDSRTLFYPDPLLVLVPAPTP